MLHILWSIVVGFLVGLIARALVPGADALGFWMTTVLGVAGSIVGGLVGRLLAPPAPGTKFHAAGFLLSLVGAIVLLVIWRMVR